MSNRKIAPSCGKFPRSIGAGGALRAGFPTGDSVTSHALVTAFAVAVDVAFDLGTSPHGLCADSWPAAKMDAVVQPSPSCKTGFDVDVEQENLPELLTFSLTEEQRSCLSFAAMCEAESLEEGDESDELEVQEAIRSLWDARAILEGLQGRSA